MTPEMTRYIKFLEDQKARAEAEFQRAKRSVDRANEKLSNPEKYFNYQKQKGAKIIDRLTDKEKKEEVKKEKTILIKKADLSQTKPVEKKSADFWD